MTDPSNEQPMESFDRGNPERRCSAKRSDGSGEQCRKWAIRGGKTCATHGSSTKAARLKARERLENAADKMAKMLLRMATDENVSEAVRLRAITEALSRAGITERTALEIEVGPTPAWLQILEGVAGVESGSRESFRRRRDGLPPVPPALAGQPTETHSGADVIDAQIVSPAEEFASRFVGRGVNGDHQADTHQDAEDAPTGRTAPGTGHSGGSSDGSMPLEDAAIAAAQLRRNAKPMPPPLAMRALPPGRVRQ